MLIKTRDFKRPRVLIKPQQREKHLLQSDKRPEKILFHLLRSPLRFQIKLALKTKLSGLPPRRTPPRNPIEKLAKVKDVRSLSEQSESTNSNAPSLSFYTKSHSPRPVKERRRRRRATRMPLTVNARKYRRHPNIDHSIISEASERAKVGGGARDSRSDYKDTIELRQDARTGRRGKGRRPGDTRTPIYFAFSSLSRAGCCWML